MSEIPKKELICPPPFISPPLPKVFLVLGKPLELWPYIDIHGRLLFFVAYFPAYGRKVKRICVSLFRKINGRLQWYAGGSPPSYQLYNQPKFQASFHETTFVIVRRESQVKLIESLFPNVIGTTWPPGIRKLDVQPLKHRNVLIWPGVSLHECAAAQILSGKLWDLGVGHTILNSLEILPEGWELGNPLPDGLSYRELFKKLDHCPSIRFFEQANARYPMLRHLVASLGYRDEEYL
ncbi:MAG: hypothetical protein LIP28_07105 [Deltaproteobacteria bacterium]|nr:hypothetical protein [Deltaproteobacteria bacterium]